MTSRLFAVAGACALAFVALGLWVTHHPLSRLDVLSAALRGRNVPLALTFTNSGYGLPLTLVGVATIAGALALRLPVKLPIAILASQLVSQAVVNMIKGFFARPRPDAWLIRHEMGFSYPSGHATTAIVFYGAWLIVLWASPLPLMIRAGGALVIAAWALGIGWSRITLGAHYPTDVIGGVLFGVGWLCLVIAVGAARHIDLVTRHG